MTDVAPSPEANEGSASPAAAASAAAAPTPSPSGKRARTKGSIRGDLAELPPPSLPVETLTSKMMAMLQERGMSQTSVCSQLALSPVYFSIWLKGRAMPDATRRLYSSACELWIEDATFSVLDPSLTRTNPSQVPRTKGGEKPAAASTGVPRSSNTRGASGRCGNTSPRTSSLGGGTPAMPECVVTSAPQGTCVIVRSHHSTHGLHTRDHGHVQSHD